MCPASGRHRLPALDPGPPLLRALTVEVACADSPPPQQAHNHTWQHGQGPTCRGGDEVPAGIGSVGDAGGAPAARLCGSRGQREREQGAPQWRLSCYMRCWGVAATAEAYPAAGASAQPALSTSSSMRREVIPLAVPLPRAPSASCSRVSVPRMPRASALPASLQGAHGRVHQHSLIVRLLSRQPGPLTARPPAACQQAHALRAARNCWTRPVPDEVARVQRRGGAGAAALALCSAERCRRARGRATPEDLQLPGIATTNNGDTPHPHILQASRGIALPTPPTPPFSPAAPPPVDTTVIEAGSKATPSPARRAGLAD